MNVEQVLNEFKKSGALLEGHFILSSGLHSDKFLQKALVFQDAKRTARLCKALAAKVKAAVILISGCQDNQTSMDGDHNGAFTEQLLRVWNRGAYKGTYAKFHAAIKAGMDPRQTPNLFTMGPASAFVKEQPFAL